MKIAYIAHPISGDIKGNLDKIKNIVREINLTEDVVPFAPYWLDCHALDDSIPEERARVIKNDHALFEKKFIDEVWLYGDRISHGMWEEIKLADKLGVVIVPKTPETQLELLTKTLSLLVDKCPEAVIGGSIALNVVGLLDRIPNDIDVFFPLGTSLEKNNFFKIEGISDLTSDTVTDTNGLSIQRTGIRVNGLRCCAFKVPDREMQHSMGEFNGVEIKVQNVNHAIMAKKSYADRSGKHKEDLAKIQDALPF